MLTKEDIDTIRRIVDNSIMVAIKTDTEVTLKNLDKEFRDIVDITTMWYEKNELRRQKLKNGEYNNSEESLCYISEEIIELRTMYKNIVTLLLKNKRVFKT